MPKKPRIKDLMQSDNPLGHSTATAMETHAKQIWRTTDKARTYASVWRLIASGSTVRKACEDCGVNAGSYSVAIQKNDVLMAHHLRALRAKSACVVDALLDTAIGNATETRTSTDADGVSSTVVTKLAPNVHAQKYVLNNLQPQQWAEKQVVEHQLTAEAQASQRAIKLATEGVIDAELA
jgi:hypothetical protein